MITPVDEPVVESAVATVEVAEELVETIDRGGIAAVAEATASAVSDAQLWDVPDDIYYGDAANSTSNSGLVDFAESIPLYYRRHILKDKLCQMKVTEQMRFGTAFHHILFGTQESVLIPDDVLGKNGAKSTNAWRDFEAAHRDQLLVTREEQQALGEMVASVMDHAEARFLIFDSKDGARVEQAVLWTCAETGLRRRCKIDRLLPSLAIVDLKTFGMTPNAENWSARVENFRYYRQAAYYQDATEALGLGRLPFFFVVVNSKPPYECELYDLGADADADAKRMWLERGHRENRHYLKQLKERQQSGNWRSATHGSLVTIQAPNFSKYSNQWEIQ